MSVTRNEMIRWLAEWYRSIDSYPSREESEAFEAIRELIERYGPHGVHDVGEFYKESKKEE
jgi:hypothetical protein